MNKPARSSTGGVDALIGGRLRALRQRAHVTQADAAARIGWEPATLSAVELGRRNLSLTEVGLIVTKLGMPLGSLLDYTAEDVDDGTRELARGLRGGEPTISDTWQAPPETEEDRAAVRRRRQRVLEDRIMQAANIDRETLFGVADELYECDVLSERDRRVQARIEAAGAEGREHEDVPSLRGWVTREMVDQIRDHLAVGEDRSPQIW